MAAGRRRLIEREFAGRIRFERRAFLLLPGSGQRPAYDDYVVAHRKRAAQLAPELGFAIPEVGRPYPRSSMPAQQLALRVQDEHPEKLGPLEDALFAAAFQRLEDIADEALLRQCAVAAGVPEGEVQLALADLSLADQATHQHEELLQFGGSGVPALVVDGLMPIVGAVRLEIYRGLLEEALALAQSP